MPSSANSMLGGGLVASIATCPLDVIKTRLQAQHHAHGSKGYMGVVATVKTILNHDGIRGLYRGLGPTILGYLPTWAIYFAVYDGIKTHFGENPLGDVSAVRHVYPAAQVKGYQPLSREHPWTLHILSAMAAGATSTICTNPLWVIKTRFMTQPFTERRYRHTFDAARTIYRTEGWRAFFRGLLPSLLGILHVGVQFPLYEQLKTWARRRYAREDLLPQQFLACSAVSKMTASIATYPHEVVRTRLQTQRRPLVSGGSQAIDRPRAGIIQTVKTIVHRIQYDYDDGKSRDSGAAGSETCHMRITNTTPPPSLTWSSAETSSQKFELGDKERRPSTRAAWTSWSGVEEGWASSGERNMGAIGMPEGRSTTARGHLSKWWAMTQTERRQQVKTGQAAIGPTCGHRVGTKDMKRSTKGP
ncbi:uncharacterized protein FIBRA_07118 [Fibroporia radiculosa]|uniref:Mitochondrial carrier n=1 Tax=Fibroporia radiculosa TaxID=599839 RepID=J4IBM5_9APHY|nr:uncharacterized protein FIBRA_07118 [Fibroporia radiculosa]CCM04921.1 predicted protein [Fibroporia radiculosa]